MTRHVKICEAKTHLSALLAEVEAGEDLVICRGPMPIAHVTRIDGGQEHAALCATLRRGRIGQHHADASMARLRRLPIRCPGEAEDHHVVALARRHRLTAYDASYLALAIREGCPLASLDRRLNDAAAAEGVAPFV